MRKVSFIELARKGAGECVAGADRWIARRWTVNVTRFLGENAQVNAITSKSMKGRVVLIDVTWLLAQRYRPFEWPRNNSSAAAISLFFPSFLLHLFCSSLPRANDRIYTSIQITFLVSSLVTFFEMIPFGKNGKTLARQFTQVPPRIIRDLFSSRNYYSRCSWYVDCIISKRCQRLHLIKMFVRDTRFMNASIVPI